MRTITRAGLPLAEVPSAEFNDDTMSPFMFLVIVLDFAFSSRA